MLIKLEHIGRRFNRDWIFKMIDYEFHPGNSYAVLGPNGSGKSTLLQIIAGSLTPSEGRIAYYKDTSAIDADQVFNYLSIAAPYIELIEEFTLSELIDFHFSFKKYRANLHKRDIISLLGLERSEHKPLRYFSSGMKQRTRLALAFCSDTPVLLLDEPASNLDNQGIEWYRGLIQAHTAGRTLIICSNQSFEYDLCRHRLHIGDYKNV